MRVRVCVCVCVCACVHLSQNRSACWERENRDERHREEMLSSDCSARRRIVGINSCNLATTAVTWQQQLCDPRRQSEKQLADRPPWSVPCLVVSALSSDKYVSVLTDSLHAMWSLYCPGLPPTPSLHNWTFWQRDQGRLQGLGWGSGVEVRGWGQCRGGSGWRGGTGDSVAV